MSKVKAWIKANPKTAGTIAAAAGGALAYLGYDPSVLKAALVFLGVM